MRAQPQFPLVDEYHGIRLGLDLGAVSPGGPVLVESPLRLQRELSYGYVRVLWWLWLDDGRSVVSAPPGIGKAVREVAAEAREPRQIVDLLFARQLMASINVVLRKAGLAPADRAFADLCFACNARLLRVHRCGDCRRLTDGTIPAAAGISLPAHCFPDGIVYGVVADGRVASVACAHRTGVMETTVADLGVETAPGYRRRGYAKTAVSAVAGHVIGCGGEARYGCSPENAASIATARAAGFVPYAVSLVLAAPAS